MVTLMSVYNNHVILLVRVYKIQNYTLNEYIIKDSKRLHSLSTKGVSPYFVQYLTKIR